MLVAGMVVVGVGIAAVALIPKTWAPLGRLVLRVNTFFAAFGARPFAAVARTDEASMQTTLVKAARVAMVVVGLGLALGTLTYASSGP